MYGYEEMNSSDSELDSGREDAPGAPRSRRLSIGAAPGSLRYRQYRRRSRTTSGSSERANSSNSSNDEIFIPPNEFHLPEFLQPEITAVARRHRHLSRRDILVDYQVFTHREWRRQLYWNIIFNISGTPFIGLSLPEDAEDIAVPLGQVLYVDQNWNRFAGYHLLLSTLRHIRRVFNTFHVLVGPSGIVPLAEIPASVRYRTRRNPRSPATIRF